MARPWNRYCVLCAFLAMSTAGTAIPLRAAVSNMAAEYSASANPNGNWTFGFLSANSSTNSDADNLAFLRTGALPSGSPGFVAYNTFDSLKGAGDGGGWTTGFGFPFAGHWFLPSGEIGYNPGGGGLTDWPSSAGENPDYPNGLVGGHTPNCNFCSGWQAARYTATTSGPVDIEIVGWQVAVYPDVPPNPAFGGATRDQQVRVDKLVGAVRTNLVRAPFASRHGAQNVNGTPQHTAADVPSPNEGIPGFYPDQQSEIDAAIASSARPNRYRLTNVNLNAGESLVISLAPQGGTNFSGFHAMNAIVRSGTDRVATTRWDLSDDWNVTGASASGIGPDAAWSYGILKSGAFEPYGRIVTGFQPEDAGTVERENHAWGTTEAGWFASNVPDPAESPIVPGMVKDANGLNFTSGALASGVAGGVATGDWGGGKVALHTPTTEVDASQTSIIRWTAPRNMTVQADGGMWRLTLPDETDRRHQYELRKGANILASGTIDELAFGPTGENSFNPESFSVAGINVTAGEVLELRISPLTSGANPAADFDNNGTVNAADLAQWRDDFGVNGDSDADNDGDSDGADFLAWQREFGASGGGGGANAAPGFIGVDFTVVATGGSIAAVPEPATAVLLAAMMGALHTRRNRRNIA